MYMYLVLFVIIISFLFVPEAKKSRPTRKTAPIGRVAKRVVPPASPKHSLMGPKRDKDKRTKQPLEDIEMHSNNSDTDSDDYQFDDILSDTVYEPAVSPTDVHMPSVKNSVSSSPPCEPSMPLLSEVLGSTSMQPSNHFPRPNNQSPPQPSNQSPRPSNQSPPQPSNQSPRPSDQSPPQPSNQSPRPSNQSPPQPSNQSPRPSDQSPPQPSNQSPRPSNQSPPQPSNQSPPRPSNQSPPWPSDQSPQPSNQSPWHSNSPSPSPPSIGPLSPLSPGSHFDHVTPKETTNEVTIDLEKGVETLSDDDCDNNSHNDVCLVSSSHGNHNPESSDVSFCSLSSDSDTENTSKGSAKDKLPSLSKYRSVNACVSLSKNIRLDTNTRRSVLNPHFDHGNDSVSSVTTPIRKPVPPPRTPSPQHQVETLPVKTSPKCSSFPSPFDSGLPSFSSLLSNFPTTSSPFSNYSPFPSSFPRLPYHNGGMNMMLPPPSSACSQNPFPYGVVNQRVAMSSLLRYNNAMLPGRGIKRPCEDGYNGGNKKPVLIDLTLSSDEEDGAPVDGIDTGMWPDLESAFDVDESLGSGGTDAAVGGGKDTLDLSDDNDEVTDTEFNDVIDLLDIPSLDPLPPSPLPRPSQVSQPPVSQSSQPPVSHPSQVSQPPASRPSQVPQPPVSHPSQVPQPPASHPSQPPVSHPSPPIVSPVKKSSLQHKAVKEPLRKSNRRLSKFSRSPSPLVLDQRNTRRRSRQFTPHTPALTTPPNNAASTRTDVPSDSADAILTSADTASPSTDTTLTSTDITLASADSNDTTLSTDITLASANTTLPSTDAVLPSTDAVLPSTDAVLPSTDAVLPSTDAVLPSTDVVLASTDTALTSPDTTRASSVPSSDGGRSTLLLDDDCMYVEVRRSQRLRNRSVQPVVVKTKPKRKSRSRDIEDTPSGSTTDCADAAGTGNLVTNEVIELSCVPLVVCSTLSPTNGPSLPTNEPLLSTNGPSLSTNGPSLFTNGPSLSTNGPSLPTDGPSSPTKRPLSPINESSLSTIRPISPTKGPLSPTNRPMSPTNGPSPPTIAPTPTDVLTNGSSPPAHTHTTSATSLSLTNGPLSPASSPLSPTNGPSSPASGPLSLANGPMPFDGHHKPPDATPTTANVPPVSPCVIGSLVQSVASSIPCNMASSPAPPTTQSLDPVSSDAQEPNTNRPLSPVTPNVHRPNARSPSPLPVFEHPLSSLKSLSPLPPSPPPPSVSFPPFSPKVSSWPLSPQVTPGEALDDEDPLGSTELEANTSQDGRDNSTSWIADLDISDTDNDSDDDTIGANTKCSPTSTAVPVQLGSRPTGIHTTSPHTSLSAQANNTKSQTTTYTMEGGAVVSGKGVATLPLNTSVPPALSPCATDTSNGSGEFGDKGPGVDAEVCETKGQNEEMVSGKSRSLDEPSLKSRRLGQETMEAQQQLYGAIAEAPPIGRDMKKDEISQAASFRDSKMEELSESEGEMTIVTETGCPIAPPLPVSPHKDVPSHAMELSSLGKPELSKDSWIEELDMTDSEDENEDENENGDKKTKAEAIQQTETRLLSQKENCPPLQVRNHPPSQTDKIAKKRGQRPVPKPASEAKLPTKSRRPIKRPFSHLRTSDRLAECPQKDTPRPKKVRPFSAKYSDKYKKIATAATKPMPEKVMLGNDLVFGEKKEASQQQPPVGGASSTPVPTSNDNEKAPDVSSRELEEKGDKKLEICVEANLEDGEIEDGEIDDKNGDDEEGIKEHDFVVVTDCSKETCAEKQPPYSDAGHKALPAVGYGGTTAQDNGDDELLQIDLSALPDGDLNLIQGSVSREGGATVEEITVSGAVGIDSPELKMMNEKPMKTPKTTKGKRRRDKKKLVSKDGATGQVILEGSLDGSSSRSTSPDTSFPPTSSVTKAQYCQAQRELPQRLCCSVPLPPWLAEVLSKTQHNASANDLLPGRTHNNAFKPNSRKFQWRM